MVNPSYEPLYVTYLVYFNRDRDYFECHEVLEELWLKLDRDPVYKGLLQIAVGLYHFRNGNYRGGYMMLDSAVHRLEHASSQALGINMAKLVDEARACARQLAEAVMEGSEELHRQPPIYRDLTIEIIEPGLRRAVEKAALSVPVNVPQQRGPRRGEKHEQRQQALEASIRRRQAAGSLRSATVETKDAP
ncbi:DUF309 domain-containing protein [Paenibacillus polymyxa]|uniref:DUF309 domain-containing protein n=1 Tax=Paenibacillus polymyxa TaxID=1406 RepID=UPI0025B69ED1|nr:DUF309 domain-containing protein [Paenibacillus polymyxa]MDN4085536.1 DUF309 domain-containing protein [Paenibacillus polymyxa]MDN4087183.1 DUF309 domain-containing protein [Paenibacillus polymyxa]MDN4108804.1 DUF309 domain-containing protein [Paenibacillus polymyxa]MEE4562305.1 DUF309 domain-containing protein [Paenibacillus polymyxa]